jgi:hypothetical protein
MSLREGNDDAATFRTRIPLPTRKPASALAAATANVVTATTTRATAGDVKSALAAATRPSRADKENDAAATARGRAASRGLGVSKSSETLKTAPNGTNASSSSRTTVPTVLTHRASDGVTIPAIPQRTRRAAPAWWRRRFDRSTRSTKTCWRRVWLGKDAKFDFKAQVAAAKAFYPKAKTLLKTFRGVIVDIAGAVEDARRESAGAILEAVVAAEDAVRDRDETSALLAAARAEAMDAAKTSAETAKQASALETKLSERETIASRSNAKPRPPLKRWKHSRKNSPRPRRAQLRSARRWRRRSSA